MGWHVVPPPAPKYSAPREVPIHNATWRLEMIGSRLQAPVSVYKVFEHISTALAEDKVVVFIVQRGKHVTLEDPASLFPSDTLITQLRLLA